MKIKNEHPHNESTHAPLWKWILIIILVVAMPLFFSFVRNVQMQQALLSAPPVPEQGHEQKQPLKEKVNH